MLARFVKGTAAFIGGGAVIFVVWRSFSAIATFCERQRAIEAKLEKLSTDSMRREEKMSEDNKRLSEDNKRLSKDIKRLEERLDAKVELLVTEVASLQQKHHGPPAA